VRTTKAEYERLAAACERAIAREIDEGTGAELATTADALRLAAEQSELHLCQCELSGDVYVLEPGKGCELCDPARDPKEPFTVENVRKALRHLSERPRSPFKVNFPETKR
jgi:hypothetical protein